MEPKKNLKYDVHRHRGIIMNISLALSISIVICAFQWSVPKKTALPPIAMSSTIDDRYIVPVTEFTNTKAAEKPKTVPLTKPVPVLAITEVNSDLEQVAQDLTGLDQGDTISYQLGPIDVPVEVPSTPIPFELVETKPAPVGGLEGFRKLLSKNLKYPRQAIQRETQGKVFVSFTISKTGEVSDIKIHKGIGDGCDEEAMRVISLSKWTPGKQRGNPVAVKMIQPIIFSLGN